MLSGQGQVRIERGPMCELCKRAGATKKEPGASWEHSRCDLKRGRCELESAGRELDANC